MRVVVKIIFWVPQILGAVVYYPRALKSSSILVMTCFPLRDYHILPKKELHFSPWGRIPKGTIILTTTHVAIMRFKLEGRILTGSSYPNVEAFGPKNLKHAPDGFRELLTSYVAGGVLEF